MQDNLKYFMVVASELNISRAAKKLFISQQCLSSHIQRLETRYNTQFFYRKKGLILTPQGRILLDALQQIKRIEDGLDWEFNVNNKNCEGTLSLGVSTSRSRLLIPDLLPKFAKLYPNVRVQIEQGGTSELEKKLLEGVLDIFIGATSVSSPRIKTTTLLDENIYLVISENLLRQYFSNDYPQCIQRFQQGADIQEFSRIPFSIGPSTSRLRHIVDGFLSENGYEITNLSETYGIDIQLSLCQMDFCACFCSQMYASHTAATQLNSENPLHIFPIKNFHQRLKVILAEIKSSYMPQYQREFIHLLVSIFQQYHLDY